MAWFQLAVGALIAATWPILITIGEVPQIAEGQRDIWFHLVAEFLTAALLVAAGVLILLGRAPRIAGHLSAVATGALLYTVINSAGYYADLGEWAAVAMFAVLAVATAAAAFALLRRAQEERSMRALASE